MVNDYLVRLSIRSAMFAGAITGFVFGLFAGATLGALLSWFAGALVDWQSQLGFSLGIAQQLLILGEGELHQRLRGRPSTRSAMMFRRISLVPASIVLPRLRNCW